VAFPAGSPRRKSDSVHRALIAVRTLAALYFGDVRRPREGPMTAFHGMRRAVRITAIVVTLGLGAVPAAGQVQPVDPDSAYNAPIDGDLEQQPAPVEPGPAPSATPSERPQAPTAEASGTAPPAPGGVLEGAPPPAAAAAATKGDSTATYREDDLIGAAEGVFGKGAKGVADMIRKALAEQGQPNGYIVGREAGGAFVVGVRYGSGTLHHKIEGTRPVYWTGPSVGFDAGASAGSTFMLVYNLYDTEDLFRRFPAGEGQAYAVGGLNASYLRWGDVVLIPIRVGAGLRLGVNAGYVKFSKEQNWLPF
jgi:hypothetical protein